MKNMNLRDLYKITFSFRKAIKEAIAVGDISEVNLKKFPDGCCIYASDLLQRYLFENEINTLFMSGSYGYGWEGERHAWLETYDGIVIDITGDQYENKTPKFTESVYVGPRADGFHDRFNLDKPLVYKAKNDLKFNERYGAVMRHMK